MTERMNKYTPTMIFLVLCMLIVLVNWNCASISSHSFVETNGKVHLYSSEVRYNSDKMLVKYCQKHFEWETIHIRYTKNGKLYQVKKNRWAG